MANEKITNADKAKAIVYHINKLYMQAISRRINAYGDYASAKARDEAWEREHKGELDWRGSGWNPTQKYDELRIKEKEEQEWKDVYDYAVDVFLSKIPEEK